MRDRAAGPALRAWCEQQHSRRRRAARRLRLHESERRRESGEAQADEEDQRREELIDSLFSSGLDEEAVPAEASNENPNPARSRAIGRTFALSSLLTLMKAVPLSGNFWPAASCALA